ncbi:hypothetical protein [Autumnicola musiva]|uniref:Uncharacterized protein n=1 Tax=Autumnicola musiva TaxID=3075589 RepID=A0ABU3D7K7_9FLAO|nr:hypothetical protein [Zunongwangia sp. F117]MDT0677421.1 hypothetical protein [Zunongwangia sp. F117]
MKNISYSAVSLIIILASALISCSSEEKIEDSSNKVAISFKTILQNVTNNRAAVKQLVSDVPECSAEEPATAVVVLALNGQNLDPVTINILSDDPDGDGNFEYYSDYSSDLELEPGEYTLEEFVVYDAQGEIVWVAPRQENGTGIFDDYIDNALPVSIDLSAGTKKYIDVEVLCYDDRLANQYGYTFFVLTPDRVYDLCFFANFCLNNEVYMADYSLELYYVREGQEDIQLYPKNDGPVTPVTGQNDEGEYYTEPLCVKIPAPQFGEADDEDYLYFKITILDWPDNYGDIEDGEIIQEGYINWDLIEILRDTDENPDTEDTDMRFLQFYINCGNPGGEDCPSTPEDTNGDCIPDNLNQYGYMFFDLEPKQLIDFCLFGNYCTPNGRHYSASYSIDVWKHENGENVAQLYDNLLSEVSITEDGEYSAEPLCIVLPDGQDDDEYYFEITIQDTGEYDVEEEVIRRGVISDSEVKALFSGEDNVEYFHFFYGCGQEDDPNLLDMDI